MSKFVLYNHITYKLSELDMRMVRAIPPGGNWKNIPLDVPSKRLEGIRATGGRTTLYGRLEWSKPSYTITTYFNRPGNGAYIHPAQDRVLSAREAARIQTFPDSYVFKGAKGSYTKQIGNAVPPLLAYAIASKIKSVDPSVNFSVDLFAGAGGLTQGFKWAGVHSIVANDNFTAACRTYEFNNPDTIMVEGDITSDLVHDKLIDALSKRKVDIVMGGPPCQGFSYAGKRLIDDPRNFLYKEFVKFVSQVDPPYFLMENVEGIMTSNGGKTFESIKADFAALGYDIYGKKVHAVEYGVPEKRKRVIIIGSKRGPAKDLFPDPVTPEAANYATVADAISNLPEIIDDLGHDEVEFNQLPATPLQEMLAGQIKPESYFELLQTPSELVVQGS